MQVDPANEENDNMASEKHVVENPNIVIPNFKSTTLLVLEYCFGMQY